MKIEQKFWTEDDDWITLSSELAGLVPQLVLVFGGRAELQDPVHYESLRSMYPESNIVLSSTAGEIIDTRVRDHTLSVCAVYFEKSELQFEEITITEVSQSEQVGASLAEKIPKEGLVHVMVFSDGLKVNGTHFVKGIIDCLPSSVSVTGGLVGDGPDFNETVVGLNAVPESGKVVMIGFYGESLQVGHGSLGGWDSFGPRRQITKSLDNVLYELDGQPALELYKKYLGEKADELPSSGLLFPLSLHITEEDGTEVEVVRTLLGVDEENQSMTFAGNLPLGSMVNLMKANFDRLVDGATGAADMSTKTISMAAPELAVLISCVGRKLVLKDRIEEETEAVRNTLGEDAIMLGFYSYGEISPVSPTEKQCKLHNQTMTITTFNEM